MIVTLTLPSGEATSASGVLREFSRADRAVRALRSFGLSVLLAALFIPIPIIHLLAIPFLLIGGAVVGIRQLVIVARLQPFRMPCPKCAGSNRVGGGLGVRNVAKPIERSCDECRRALRLMIADP